MVLKVFLNAPQVMWSGTCLSKETGLGATTVYQILHRLEGEEWLNGYWESQKIAAKLARPQRRYYRMTKLGRDQAGKRLK